ncbi:hypothetical protein HYPBUDRAFT_137035 [Hyphopichia burtonii NRRL Y-1933]|uniref:CinA C-terminal domain-containing protein n=1 Tax=Hyphopichia burtonii NRRL Y-1933 TaxID=984485 RepID=A0A1E4RK34_9ASCO|nr:hypothetical protein HYPBUDRAFT_137035 [Hyphopichia burtonii NRRL Y-1933]ODV67603.1 hypothetical protein HYPBUDRAFT_137035 [Hyphopichia burtonii NRRL Y-1933]
MGFPDDEIKQLVDKIAVHLRSKNQTLAISEAACGGLISAYLVSVPGASNFYIGGKLVYSLKQRLKVSGWTEEEISDYMGPSELVALKLARTTKYELGSTYVLSETGFAGPSTDLHLENHEGSQNSKVGTVYLGLNGPNGEVSCSRSTGSNDRSFNMTEFAKLGLQFLLETLQNI